MTASKELCPMVTLWWRKAPGNVIGAGGGGSGPIQQNSTRVRDKKNLNSLSVKQRELRQLETKLKKWEDKNSHHILLGGISMKIFLHRKLQTIPDGKSTNYEAYRENICWTHWNRNEHH